MVQKFTLEILKNELADEKLKDIKYPIKLLTDDQAILILDHKVKFLGDGEEEVF